MVSALSLRAVETSLLVVLAICGAVPATAQRVNIVTAGQGDIVTVRVSAEMQVDLSTVWRTISDYDHLAEFIPNMRSSRVMQRNGVQVLVEPAGASVFFSSSILSR